MLSTKGTRACGLYQACAAKHGFTLYIPNEEESDASQEVIDKIKANDFSEAGLCAKIWWKICGARKICR